MARIIADKLLFIHVAKTGGTFVREATNFCGIPNYETGIFEEHDHYGIKKLQNFKELYSFGIIRKPVPWMVSRWKWGMFTEFGEKIKGNTSAAKHWMAQGWSNDLNTFLTNSIEFAPGIATKYMFDMLDVGGAHEVNQILIDEDLTSLLIHLYHTKLDINISEKVKTLPRYKSMQTSTEVHPMLGKQIEWQNKELFKLYESIRNPANLPKLVSIPCNGKSILNPDA